MLQIGGRKIMSSKINIICALLYCLFHLVASESSIEGEDDFRIDVNILKFISEQTALVQQSIELDYVFSVEDGGYKETKYEGKICTASHPDQFFTNCYLPHQQPHTEMIWYFTDRYDHEDNAKFNPSEVKFCRKDMDQVCRYKSDDGNKTTFITHVIIADPDIIHKEVFGLLKRFDNPNDILILRADEDQLELIRNNSIQVNNNITSSVYHQIDFRCGMLKDEASVS